MGSFIYFPLKLIISQEPRTRANTVRGINVIISIRYKMGMTQFPHIHRKLTAAILFIFFLAVAIANLAQNQLFPTSEEKTMRFELMRHPDESFLHEKLGQYYLGMAEKEAEREYRLAEEYYPPDSISTRPADTWQNLSRKKHNLEDEIQYWQKVVQTYPDYHYAYLKLAVVYWQKGETANAKDYLTMLSQDPLEQNTLKLFEALK